MKKGWYLLEDKILQLLRAYKIYAKMDLLWFLRDTKYCLLQIFADVISLLSTLIGLILLSFQFGGIGGFSTNQILFMFGVSSLVQGLYNMFFANYNNGMISRIIGRGQIDHYVTQPAPIWMQIITRGFAPISGNSQFIISLFLLVYSMRLLNLLSFKMVAIVCFSSICSLVTLVSIIYLISATAFYSPASAEEISEPILALFLNTCDFPLGNLGFIQKLLFTFIIPVGSIAWLPTVIIFKKNNLTLLILIIIPFIFLCLSTLTFRKGLNYYAKKGSTRYSGFGHR